MSHVWIIMMHEPFEGSEFHGVAGSLKAAKRLVAEEWGWKFPWTRYSPTGIVFRWASGTGISIERHKVTT